MNKISLAQAYDAISDYLNGFDNRPYFVLVDDDATCREVISFVGGNAVKTSNYCIQDDSFPDMDCLITGLESLPKGSKNVLLGFGEALNLQFNPNNDNDSCTSPKIRKVSSLKDKYFPGKTVVLCRFLYSEIQQITRYDLKFTSDRYCYISQQEGASCKIIQTSRALDYPTLNGFKELLRKLENCDSDNKKLYVRSVLPLNNVAKVNTAFEAIQIEDTHFKGEQNWLTDQQWEEYLADNELPTEDALHWRTFLDLKFNGASGISKEYKSYVANHCSTYSEYKNKVFSALLDFSPNDEDFVTMYKQRKQWIKNVEESSLGAFISSDLICKSDQFQLYYLTDNTSIERQAILKWLSKNELTDKVRKDLQWIYPDLYWYLSPYHFNQFPNIDNTFISNEEFDNYFERYRLQKVVNYLSEEFNERVNQYSLTRPYNILTTRGATLEQFQQDNPFLYWLDALGVEYLPFIQNWAKEHDLNMTTYVSRSILPTITSKNKEFFDTWNEDMKKKNEELDKVKHEGVPGVKEAQYLEKELEIIKSALDEIVVLLNNPSTQINNVVLTSDHGASRLAVLSGQENRWRMQNDGEHSGRCCLVSELDDRPDCATEEDGFWVIANYQRFRGGRKADVEVHGGATLEEVVVPVIEFSLKTEKIIKVKEPTTIKVNSDKTAVLYLACSQPLNNAWVKWNDKSYPVQQQDETTYCVTFKEVNVKAGEQEADVYENDTYLNSITFKLEKGFGKSSGIEDMFG